MYPELKFPHIFQPTTTLAGIALEISVSIRPEPVDGSADLREETENKSGIRDEVELPNRENINQ
jgi:hypothetical protein